MNAVHLSVDEGQTSALAIKVAIEVNVHHVEVEGLHVRKHRNRGKEKWHTFREAHGAARAERAPKRQRRRRHALPVVSAVFKRASELTDEDLAGFDLGN